MSWVNGVRANLRENPPSGWAVLESITGRGVQLLPADRVFLEHNQSGRTLELVGEYKLVFEFFRLDQDEKVKISARVAGIEGHPLFHEFWGVARALGCPKPKGTTKKITQSVAAWPASEERSSFPAKSHQNMADWVSKFLQNPPADFVLFVAAARNLLTSKS
jgi:hypothetical protein